MTSPPPPINPVVAIQPLLVTNVAQNTAQNPVLAGAKHGDVIEGFVVNRDAQQNPILRTPLGDILVKSDIFLKTGAQVQIRVDAQLASRARIVLIDGQSPENYVKLTQSNPQKSDAIMPSSLLALAKFSANGQATQALLSLPAIVLRQQEAVSARQLSATPTSSGKENAKASASTTSAAASASTPSGASQSPKPLPMAGAHVQVTILASSLSGRPLPDNAPIQPNQATQTAPTEPLNVAKPVHSNAITSATNVLQNAPAPSGAPMAMSVTSPVGVQAMPENTSLLPGNSPASPATANQALGQPQLQTLAESKTISAVITPENQTASASNSSQADIKTPANSPIITDDDMAMLLRASSAKPNSQNISKTAPPALTNSALSAQEMANNAPLQRNLASQQALPVQYKPALSPASTQAVQSRGDVAANVQATSAGNVSAAPSAASPSATSIPSSLATTPSSIKPDPTSFVMQVIGHEADGASIIRSNELSLKLFTAKPLPAGALLHVSITPQDISASPASLLPSRLIELGNVFTHWESMEEAMAAVSTLPAASPSSLPLSLTIAPEIGSKLAHDILFFVNALRVGDIKAFWPKALVEALETNHYEVFQRVQNDMAALAPLANPATPSSWASYIIPMLFGQQLEHMRLYVRGDDRTENDHNAIHNQRFIMEISLKNLSDMQLDGFVQGKAKPQQFDLVIRSERALPQDVEHTIESLFLHGIQTTRLKGRIHFQTGREHFVIPETPSTSDTNTGSADDYTLLA